MDLEDKVKEYFQGLWPGMETAEQCNTSMSFTPLAIMRMVEHFYNLGKIDTKNIQEVQKYWYLLGWGDKEHNEKQLFVPEQDEPTYTPVRMDDETFEHIRQMDYENGKKDKEEEFMKLAFKYKLIGVNNIEQLDMDELAKRGIHWNDNLKVIILKDEDKKDE